MKKELLNALKNLDTETIIDFVDSEMKDIFKLSKTIIEIL